jgi:hypothetical protein
MHRPAAGIAQLDRVTQGVVVDAADAPTFCSLRIADRFDQDDASHVA